MTNLFAKVYSYCLILIAILPLAANAQTIWSGEADTDWYTDEQTEFTITTAEQLAGLAQLVNYDDVRMYGKTIKLGNDIRLNDTTNWKNWASSSSNLKPWVPIGTATYNFYGTFDGDGHIISGVYINSTTNYQGLFGYEKEGTIKNLGLLAFYIKGGSYVGGLAGYNNNGTINNSYATGTVEGTSYVGGLVGCNRKDNGDGIISNSYAEGTVTVAGTATIYVGGLVGVNNGGMIINSYATSAVTVTINGTGSGTRIVGGLVGYNYYNGIINNNYAAGEVKLTGGTGGTEYVGGLVGYNYGSIYNSYYDKETSKQSDTGKGEPKTTADMKNGILYASLQSGAHVLSMNNWYNSINGKYPTLKSEVKIQEYFSGMGTKTEPYIIETEEDLKNLSLITNSGIRFDGEYLKLNTNITLSGEWTAIGTSSLNPFNGTFDGGGYVISDVRINSPDDYQGLFGYVDKGTIKNLGLADIDIKGKDYVGGLAGYVGGFTGYNSAGAIINSYAIGKVKGENYVGGLAGSIEVEGTISNSYSAVEVKGTGSDVGGLTGSRVSTINNGYYDKEVSKQNDNYGVGKTTAEMQSEGFVNNLNKGAAILSMNEWVYATNKYPAFSQTTGSFDISKYFASGSGTAADPYIIQTKEQLEYFSFIVNSGRSFSGKHLKLDNDIELDKTESWTRIGTPYNPFSGTFDGGNYAISGIYINSTSDYQNYQGLFGYVKEGTIKNLGVADFYIYIYSGESFGGLVGYNNEGTIVNSHATGNINVRGGSCAGILVGLSDGAIIGSSATGNVTGGSYSDDNGGLVGCLKGEGGTISNSHSTVNVSGRDEIGGLVGSLFGGTIDNSYATGNVTSNAWGGGLVGEFVKGTISNSYATGNVVGSTILGGLVGDIDVDGIISKSFAIGDVTGTGDDGSRVGGLVGSCGSYTNVEISESYATGTVTGTKNQVGGLVGKFNGGTIINSYSTGDEVKGGSQVGGLVGYIGSYDDYPSTISNSYATRYVSGTNMNIGGLVGQAINTSISDSYATGTVAGLEHVGGLVGDFYENGTINNSYAEGDVTGSGDDVGGLVGLLRDKINNSYATGNVTGEKSNVGGLVGRSSGKISNSYSTGKVKGKSKVGGFLGAFAMNASSKDITYSYYDIETSGQIDIGKGEPRSTSQMKYKSTYSRWDFNEIWGIDKNINNGYPHLKFNISSSSADGGSSSSSSSNGSSSSGISSGTGESSSSSETTTKSTQHPNTILLSNLPPNTKIEVYNLKGKRIYSAYPENNHPADVRQRESSVGASQILAIGVQTKGVYIVKIKNSQKLNKVIIFTIK